MGGAVVDYPSRRSLMERGGPVITAPPWEAELRYAPGHGVQRGHMDGYRDQDLITNTYAYVHLKCPAISEPIIVYRC